MATTGGHVDGSTMFQNFADWLFYSLLALDPTEHWVAAIHFFVYESLKVAFLLGIITLFMGTVNAYFPVERVRQWIASGRLRGSEHFIASLFGAVTPFCSCSSIPLFIGFLQGGIPLGITFSFLITSPLVNEVALALFLGMFGWKVTLVYAVSGILLGTIVGPLLGRMKLERYVEAWVWKLAGQQTAEVELSQRSFRERLPGITHEAWSIIRRVGPYVLAGIAVGAAVHGYVPQGFFERYITRDNPLAVPVAVLVAVPLYANAAGIVPVVGTLVAKGIPMGTALAFMMGTVGLSLPEAMILKKVMTLRLLGIFFGSVAFAIILLGYFFNVIL